MKCLHLNSQIINSRKHGVKNYPKKFPYIKYRRRYCFDCKQRFTTFELTIEQMGRAK